jgi:hypothetical protein
MSDLPRDTPVETPAVLAPVQLAVDTTAASALARVHALETLEHAFTVWGELRAAERAARRRWEDERKALRDQGELLLGAVRVARQVAPPATGETAALATTDLLGEAQARLDAAVASLEEQIERSRGEFERALRDVRAEVLARVARLRDGVKPAFRVSVRVLAGDRRILHARRFSEDEAVIAMHVLSGHVPSRYGYLFDDSTDDLSAPPPTLYAEEGVDPSEVRLSGQALVTRLGGLPEVWPLKGLLPMPTPVGFARWLQRGAVMEAELVDGDGFRNLLTKEEAEQLTGLLLAHKLAGRLELELVRE